MLDLNRPNFFERMSEVKANVEDWLVIDLIRHGPNTIQAINEAAVHEPE